MTPHSAPENWFEVCKAKVDASKLTSNPQKLAFMRERGMTCLAEVHDFMLQAHRDFINMVNEASKNA